MVSGASTPFYSCGHKRRSSLVVQAQHCGKTFLHHLTPLVAVENPSTTKQSDFDTSPLTWNTPTNMKMDRLAQERNKRIRYDLRVEVSYLVMLQK